MCAREIRKRYFCPAVPVSFEQTRAREPRILIAERIVISEHGWTTIETALMRRNDVTKRRALVKNVVPRERKITSRGRLRPVFQREVRHHPGAKMKLGDVRGRIVSIRPHDIASHELWRREDHALRVKATRSSSL